LFAEAVIARLRCAAGWTGDLFVRHWD
jgi:hypothetical protein